MGTELGILGLYGLVVLATIFAQVLTAQAQVGLPMLLKPRDDIPKLTGIAGRMERAQLNSIVALALVAPAILILATKGNSTATTLLAAQIFLIARILYVPVYAAGLPWARTLVWLAGFLATAWLYVAGMGGAVAAA